MPVFVESGFLAVLNDIDGRDACVPEHKKVVVGYDIPFFFYEITSVAQVIGRIPYFPVDAFGKLFGVSFVEESGVFGAYHIKKDAKTRIISLDMGILCPVLRTERPILFLMVACIGLVRAVVFGIYQYDVDAQLG